MIITNKKNQPIGELHESYLVLKDNMTIGFIFVPSRMIREVGGQTALLAQINTKGLARIREVPGGIVILLTSES